MLPMEPVPLAGRAAHGAVGAAGAGSRSAAERGRAGAGRAPRPEPPLTRYRRSGGGDLLSAGSARRTARATRPALCAAEVAAQVCCRGALHRCDAEVRCTGAMQRCAEQVRCAPPRAVPAVPVPVAAGRGSSRACAVPGGRAQPSRPRYTTRPPPPPPPSQPSFTSPAGLPAPPSALPPSCHVTGGQRDPAGSGNPCGRGDTAPGLGMALRAAPGRASP